MDVFGAYARYYDLLYRDKDYAGEAAYVDSLIRRDAPGAATLLDLGCGTGAHAEQFVRLGYTVHGVDASAGMLEAAHARRARLDEVEQVRLSFAQGDARCYRCDRRFDVVTALFHVMSYQVTDEDLAAAFRTAASHLITGGLFIFDFWHGPGVLSDPPEVRQRSLEDADTEVRRIATPKHFPDRNLVEVGYKINVRDKCTHKSKILQESHSMRYLFAEEISSLSRGEGFEVAYFGGWMSDQPLKNNQWYAVACLTLNA